MLINARCKKSSVNADERVKQNMEKGKGLRFTTSLTNDPGGGNFSFASSNPHGELV